MSSKLSRAVPKFLLSSIIISMLSACGGGGSGESKASLELTDTTISGINGGIINDNILDVLANDSMDNLAIDLEKITITTLSIDEPLTLNENMVSVRANTNAGTYSLTYQVCEKAVIDNCVSANVHVIVDKGVFMVGAQGVRYQSDSVEGITDEHGGYEYSAGDSVSFYLGATQLGETVAASSNIALFDLVPGAEIPVAARDVNQYLDNDGDFETYPLISELINITALVYSADKDKSADNGIVVDEQLHQLWSDTQLLTKQRIYNFDDDNALTIALYKAFNNDLIANAQVLNHYIVLDMLAGIANVEPQVYGKNKEFYGSGNTISEEYTISWNDEQSASEWLYVELDEEGNIELESEYLDRYFYDENLNYLGWESFEGDTFSSKSRYEIDIHGKRLNRVYQNNGGEPFTRYIYKYNEFGFRSEYHRFDANRLDRNSSEYTQFDENGNETLIQIDSLSDGVIDEETHFEYENNLVTKETYYYLPENETELVLGQILYNFYDEQGLKIKYQYDEQGDGSIDSVSTTSYNDAGQKLKETSDHDLTLEGVEHVVDYVYENGLMVEVLIDSDNDGIKDYVHQYQYDERGNQIEFRYYNDGLEEDPLFIYTYVYDEYDNRLEYRSDHNGDGIDDSITVSEYDEFGNESRYVRYNAPDTSGEPRYQYIYEYIKTNFVGKYRLEN